MKRLAVIAVFFECRAATSARCLQSFFGCRCTLEARETIEGLPCPSYFVSDHIRRMAGDCQYVPNRGRLAGSVTAAKRFAGHSVSADHRFLFRTPTYLSFFLKHVDVSLGTMESQLLGHLRYETVSRTMFSKQALCTRYTRG